MREGMETALREASAALEAFRQNSATFDAMAAIVEAVSTAFKNRGRVFACGNGGSMADAMHFAEEFSGRFDQDREPYPALALSDPAHLTCVANDYGFEHVFSRQVEAFGHEGDVLLILSTSGNSPNIVKAAEAGKARGMTVVGCLGKGGGKVAPLCDIVLHAPGARSDRIQELHMLALHAIIEAVEREMNA
ncbi:MAG TPA: SIS domain-containing protein [Fimbriimonadaceae bacterium]|nr:SIS domain-containing protein [Fimbriimonadaceae bacterium]